MNAADPLPPPTHVTFSLAPTLAGTDLRVRHVGFGDSEDCSAERNQADNTAIPRSSAHSGNSGFAQERA